MAEASCSGGTPFKRLIDHQSRDVSHHQDRLINHSAPGQSSFRSSPLQPGQGRQDGFGAFMSGNSALPGFQHDPASRLAAHAASLQSVHAGPAGPQLGFSGPAQIVPAPNASNWAADFGRFSTQSRPAQNAQPHAAASRQMNQSPAQLNFQAAFAQPAFAAPMFAPPVNGAFMEPEAAQRPGGQNDFDQEMARWMTAHGSGNMEDVDAAMDQMARELEESETAVATAEIATLAPESQTIQNTPLTDLETPEIGSLSLELKKEPPAPAMEQDQVAADANGVKSAVAEAAEKLLECVKHEGGEKWQNSVFLSLMRDFRDGRKDIVGDEIRPTGEETPTAQPLT